MAKITLSPEAKKLVTSLRSQIASLQEQLEAAKARRAGVRSDGTEDRYTAMDSAELRGLVIKRGGDPDEIVHGFHSRQRSIKLREWLRSHPARGADSKPAKATPRKAKVEEPAPRKRTTKPAAKVEPQKTVKKKRSM